jgi:hypothetical protein
MNYARRGRSASMRIRRIFSTTSTRSVGGDSPRYAVGLALCTARRESAKVSTSSSMTS